MSYREVQFFPLNQRYQLDVQLRECLTGIDKISYTYADRVESLLRFPSLLMEEFGSTPEHSEKFSFRYLNGDNFVEFSQSMFSLHYEGPRSLVLYLDTNPLCVVSFQNISNGLMITQIQGNKRYKWGKNKHGRSVMLLQPHNNELSKFSWSKVLVRGVEEIARLEGKKRVVVLPYSMNRWPRIKNNEEGQGEKNYNTTALELGYILSNLPEIQITLGKKRKGQVFVKDLK